MQLSARNQLRGTVKEITLGNIVAEIIVSLPDGQEITSVITYRSSEKLNLQVGDTVLVVVKSTDVLIAKE